MGRPRKNHFAPASEPETVEKQGEEVTEIVEGIAEQSAASSEPETVEKVISNPGKNVRRIGGIILAPGGVYTLTDRDLADTKSMAKVEHMIKLGVLHRGSGR